MSDKVVITTDLLNYFAEADSLIAKKQREAEFARAEKARIDAEEREAARRHVMTAVGRLLAGASSQAVADSLLPFVELQKEDPRDYSWNSPVWIKPPCCGSIEIRLQVNFDTGEAAHWNGEFVVINRWAIRGDGERAWIDWEWNHPDKFRDLMIAVGVSRGYFREAEAERDERERHWAEQRRMTAGDDW